MKNYFASVQKEFDYSAFVDELIPLIDQARNLDISERRQDSDVFRKWRLTVSDLIIKVCRTHMDVNCGIDERQFRVMSYYGVTDRVQLKAFDRDMQDTLNELQNIVDWHNKYGEPGRRDGGRKAATEPASAPVMEVEPVPVKASEPRWPQDNRLTLYWLVKHMPISAWAAVGVGLFAAFTFGTTVGSWEVTKGVIASWTAASDPQATAPIRAPAQPNRAASRP